MVAKRLGARIWREVDVWYKRASFVILATVCWEARVGVYCWERFTIKCHCIASWLAHWKGRVDAKEP
jgi:hypothetical protein